MIYEEFLKRWERDGYKEIKMNLWQENRLYLNIKGEATIYYMLDQNIEESCYFASSVKLNNRLWDEARKQGFFLWKYRKKIAEELKSGKYVTTKKISCCENNRS